MKKKKAVGNPTFIFSIKTPGPADIATLKECAAISTENGSDRYHEDAFEDLPVKVF